MEVLHPVRIWEAALLKVQALGSTEVLLQLLETEIEGRARNGKQQHLRGREGGVVCFLGKHLFFRAAC